MRDPTASATERVGRYQLLEPIGIGPNGSVARAKVFGVAGFERQFAIKRFVPELTVQSSHAQALSAAARAYGSLEHPRIARMNEFGVAQGTTFTAVEFVGGLDAMRLLAETKMSGNALATGGVLALVSQAARAVGYAHGRGISHLGLAPTNVIVTPEGDVKVTDFGVLSATLPPRPVDTPRLGRRIAYLAPEQLTGESTSAATDVFALGVLAYELLGGQPVYRGDTPQQVAHAILAGPPPDPMLPRPIVRVLQRCLARSPFERFPDARALADALDAALRVAPVPGTRKDIGAQVKAAIDRIAQLHETQMSGMLALHVGTGVATEPTPLTSSAELDIQTSEYVRPDVPVPGPAPLVGPGRMAQPPSAPPLPELPKGISKTVFGVAPPPIPTPQSMAASGGAPAQPPPVIPTLVGMPGAKKTTTQIPPVIPPIGGRPLAATVQRVPNLPPTTPPPIPTAPRAATPPPIPVIEPSPPPSPAQGRGMTNLIDDLQDSAEVTIDRSPPDDQLPMTTPGLPALTAMEAETILRKENDADLDSTVATSPKNKPRSISTDIAEEIAQDPRVQTIAEAIGRPRTNPGFTPAKQTPPTAVRTLGRVPVEDATPRPVPVRAPSPPLIEHSLSQLPPDEEIDSALDGLGGNTATSMMSGTQASVLNRAMRAPTGQINAVQIDPGLEGESLRPTPVPTLSPMQATMTPAAMMTIAPPTLRHDEGQIGTAGMRAAKPTRWPIYLGLGLVLAAGFGIGGWYLWSRMESPTEQVDVGKPNGSGKGTGAGSGSVAVTGSGSAVRSGGGSSSGSGTGSGSSTGTGSGSGSSTGSGSGSAVAVVGSGSATGSATVAMAADAGVPARDAAVAKADAGAVQPTGTSDSLQVASTPAGARVFLDGADQGITPLKLQGTADRHNLALLSPGYELYVAQVDGHGQFKIELKPVTPLGGPAGIKVVNCKQKERYYVFVDGKPTGMTCPTERIHCDIGPHVVEVYDVISESRQKFEINVADTRLSYRVRLE